MASEISEETCSSVYEQPLPVDYQRKFTEPSQILTGPPNSEESTNGLQPLRSVSGSHHLPQEKPTHSKNPTPVESSEQAVNTIAGIAPPSKSSSTPLELGPESQPEKCDKAPEAASGEDDYATQPFYSSRESGPTFVSAAEHTKTVNKLESQIKSKDNQNQLEVKQGKELQEENEKLHRQRSKLQTYNVENHKQLCELGEDHKKTQDELETVQKDKRLYERRTSILEDELRVANEKIEELKKENGSLTKGVTQLNEEMEELKKENGSLTKGVTQLNEEIEELKKENGSLKKEVTQLREELQKKVSNLEALFKEKCN